MTRLFMKIQKTHMDGFSLIEALVALGILGAASVFFMNYTNNVNKKVSDVNVRDAISSYKRELVTQIFNRRNCSKNFQNMTFRAQNIAANGITNVRLSTYAPNGTIVKTLAENSMKVDGNNHIILEDIKLKFQNSLGANFPSGESEETAELTFKISHKVNNKTLYSKTEKLPFNFKLQTDNNGNSRITDCILQDEADPVIQTPTYHFGSVNGGWGGGQFVLQCPLGTFATGVHMRSGWEVDGIQLICEGGYPTYYAGSGGGGPTTVNCPTDSYISGIYGRRGGLVDQINFRCTNYKSQVTTSHSGGGGGGGGDYSDSCPQGMYVFEFRGRAGARLDHIQIVCRKL